METENFSFPIFECLNPKGKIGPLGESAMIEIKFTPIQDKEYSVQLPIRVNGSETKSAVTILGRGFNPSQAVRHVMKYDL